MARWVFTRFLSMDIDMDIDTEVVLSIGLNFQILKKTCAKKNLWNCNVSTHLFPLLASESDKI